MRSLFIIVSLALLAACSKKEDISVNDRSKVDDSRGWPTYVQEHVTESGTKCVIATYTAYGVAISCDWK